MHHGNKNGLRRNRMPYVVRIDAAESVDRQVRHCGAEPLKEPARIDDGRMFHLRCDEVSFVSPLREEHAFQGVIVGFASPAGEYNLFRPAIE